MMKNPDEPLIHPASEVHPERGPTMMKLPEQLGQLRGQKLMSAEEEEEF